MNNAALGHGQAPAPVSALPAHEFASLWHPWDFIEAKTPPPGSPLQWQRIKTFPLEPRPLMHRWGDPKRFIGVSFGNLTRYCMADIDSQSQYHPHTHPSAYRQVLEGFEAIGLVEPLVLTSSDSGGLHLYFPLPVAQKSYALAKVLKQTCEQASLEVKPGQLELFPNLKQWNTGSISLYQAHRLPLQTGSYLLDSDGNICGNDLSSFMHLWNRAAGRQDIEQLQEAIAEGRAAQKVVPFTRRSERARAYYEDDLARIEQGWTGSQQTNGLLCAIGRFGRIWEELEYEELAAYIERTAIALPGYTTYCGHQHHIRKRCRDWAKWCAEHYYPYSQRSRDQPKQESDYPSNEERSRDARERVTEAVSQLEEAGELPTGIAARCEKVAKLASCSQTTLYKHKELWHPAVYPATEKTIPSVPDDRETALLQPLLEGDFEGLQTPPIRSLGFPCKPSSQQEASGIRSSLEEKNKKEQTKSRAYGYNENSSSSGDRDELLNRARELVGESWTKTLERLVLSADVERVESAIAALREQIERGQAIANLGAWFNRAIVEGYRPNKSLPSDETELFGKWFDAAKQSGLAIASEREEGCIQVHLSDGSKVPWSEMKSKYPLDSLRSAAPGALACSESISDKDQLAATEPSASVPMPLSIREWIAREKLKRFRC